MDSSQKIEASIAMMHTIREPYEKQPDQLGKKYIILNSQGRIAFQQFLDAERISNLYWRQVQQPLLHISATYTRIHASLSF